MVLPLPTEEPTPDELGARLERIESALAAIVSVLAGVETLLERYSPLLAAAEARMSGGRFGIRKGAARVRDENESAGR